MSKGFAQLLTLFIAGAFIYLFVKVMFTPPVQVTQKIETTSCGKDFLLRKDFRFEIDSPAYTTGDPNEKFCLGGKDKDLSVKARTMNRVGMVTIDGEEKEVWRCHATAATCFAGLCNLDEPLKYLYVMKDASKFIMDVYLTESEWDTLPHDEETIDITAPIDDVVVDFSTTLHSEEKFYQVQKETSGAPKKQALTAGMITSSFNLQKIVTGADITGIGNVDIYEAATDTTNAFLFAIEAGRNVLDGSDHEFFVLVKIQGYSRANLTAVNTLQLKTFKFVTIAKDSWWIPDCKPAIYLYPEQKTDVRVQVSPKGKLDLTIPPYPKDGWLVTAYPNGNIDYQNKSYEYLYYEAQMPDNLITKPKEGFVVEKKDVAHLFNDILPKLGLNEHERTAFSDYWVQVLPQSNYYFVGIIPQNQLNEFAPITVVPKPDKVIRVTLYFQALDAKIDVATPIINTPTRDGFTVVEWGGIFKRDKDHPFSCFM